MPLSPTVATSKRPTAATTREQPPPQNELRAGAFETSAVGIAIVGFDDEVLDANDKLCKMLGRTRSELLSLTLRKLTYEEDRRTNTAFVIAAMNGERDGYSLRKRYVARDGSLIWARLTVTLVRDETGLPKHFVSVIEDQSDLHSAELKALAAERHFTETLNQSPVGVVLTSFEGRFLSTNTYFANLLGYEPSDLEGQDYREFSAPEDVPVNAPARSALWGGHVARVVAEKRWLHRDGHRIWTRVAVSIAREIAGHAPYSISIIEDITAVKQAEESQRLLVGELNHRVKNTLAVVQGLVKRTLANTPNPEAFAERLEGRLQSISAAHDLLSRNEWRDLSLASLIRTTITEVFSDYARAFEIAVDDVCLSPHQATTLALLFHELTTNAIKHGALSRQSGRVHLNGQLRPGTEDAPAELIMSWKETGGPELTAPPDQHGFGSFLLRRGISHSLAGTADHKFHRDGLIVEWTFPVDPTLGQGPIAHRMAPT